MVHHEDDRATTCGADGGKVGLILVSSVLLFGIAADDE